MDELIPLIISKDVELDYTCWCYAHKRRCHRGLVRKSTDPSILNLLILGSPCVDPKLHLESTSWIQVYWFSQVASLKKSQPSRPLPITTSKIAEDYSTWGQRLGFAGKSVKAFLTMCRGVKWNFCLAWPNQTAMKQVRHQFYSFSFSVHG